MTGPAFTELYQALDGKLTFRDAKSYPVVLGLYWKNTQPAEMTLSLRNPVNDDMQVWSVARSLFVAAGHKDMRGAWYGGGDFAACHAAHLCMMAFRPHGTGRHAVLFTDGAKVNEFIDHTNALIPAGSDTESDITQQYIDQLVAEILA